MSLFPISECHSHQNPAVCRSGSVGWAFLSTASLLTWSSSLPQLWHGGRNRKCENLAAAAHTYILAACQNTEHLSVPAPTSLIYILESVFAFFSASQRDLLSASEKQSHPLWVWVLTHSIFISALSTRSKTMHLAQRRAAGSWVHPTHGRDPCALFWWIWRLSKKWAHCG